MDGWTSKLKQFLTLLRGFSPTQRVALGVVALVVLAGCGWLGYASSSPPQEFLLGGKSFSKDDLSRTLEAFKAAGLAQHRVDGQRIAVPASEVDRYTAAAVAQKALPVQFAAEFDRMQSRVNIFTSSEQRKELMEEARKTRLAQILRAIPEIEDAVVEWERTKSTSLFRPQTQLAAHVSVRPRDGRELSFELVQSLKQFIAGALAGAKPEDVTVVDMNTSRVFGRRTSAEAVSDRLQSLTRQTSEEVTRQINHALQYIPNVLVAVNVELLSEDESLQSEAIDDPEIIPIRRQSKRSNADQRGAVVSAQTIQARSNRPVVTGSVSIDPVSLSKRQSNRSPASRFVKPVELEFDSEEDENAFHKSVQVAITIPEDYYTSLARRQGRAPGKTLVADSEFRSTVANIKTESQRDIREKLTRLLPVGTPPEAISITSYVRPGTAIETDVVVKNQSKFPAIPVEWMVTGGSILAGAICVIGLLRRPRNAALSADSAAKNPTMSTLQSPSAGDSETVRLLSRDRQGTVNDNNFGPLPDMHGSVINPPLESPRSNGVNTTKSAIVPPGNTSHATGETLEQFECPLPMTDVSDSSAKPLNPYSAILVELAERERDTVLGVPPQVSVFEFLCHLTPADIADFLRNEHPQTIALVATGLPAGRAAEVLYALPEALRWDVTQRISRMEPPVVEVCQEIAQNLSIRLQERQSKMQTQGLANGPHSGMSSRHSAYGKLQLGSSRTESAGTGGLANPTPGSSGVTATFPAGQSGSRPVEQSPVDHTSDPGPVKFEDLCLLDRRAFTAVLRIVDAKSFAIALFDQTDPFKQRFLSLVPRTMAAAVLQQTRALGPLRLSDISAAQIAIATVIWKLAQQGAINLPKHLIRPGSAALPSS